MRLEGRDGNSVSLSVLGYEHAELRNDPFDDNWLIIEGNIVLDQRRWRFREPSLLVFEARKMAAWMNSVADGDVPVTLPERPGHVWPALYFIEPNLAFSVGSRKGSLIGLRVHLSLESAPTVRGDPDHTDIYQYFFDLPMVPDELRDAAKSWTQELEPFPERTTSCE